MRAYKAFLAIFTRELWSLISSNSDCHCMSIIAEDQKKRKQDESTCTNCKEQKGKIDKEYTSKVMFSPIKFSPSTKYTHTDMCQYQ